MIFVFLPFVGNLISAQVSWSLEGVHIDQTIPSFAEDSMGLVIG